MTGHQGTVVDLRQYTLVPGRRDELIELFDQHFVDGQEAAGIHVIGQFRDLDDPDRFVWLRGFDSLSARGESLPRFYYGQVWKTYREQANATIVDSDDALLLEPVHLAVDYPDHGATRADEAMKSVVGIDVAYLAGPITSADLDLAHDVQVELATASADVVAVFSTHVAENNFPVLPLREEHVLVWVTRFRHDDEYACHLQLLTKSSRWTEALDRLASRSNRLPMQRLRLRPTSRSQLW